MEYKVFLTDKSVDGPKLEEGNWHFAKRFIGAAINEDFITLDGLGQGK